MPIQPLALKTRGVVNESRVPTPPVTRPVAWQKEGWYRRWRYAMAWLRVIMPSMRCPTCAAWISQPPVGHPRVYCGNACRQKAYRDRRRYPLGSLTLATWGIEDVSLMSMLTAGRSDRSA